VTWVEDVIEGITIGVIAFVSALIAISATSGRFPCEYDLYTSGLAGLLAGLVRWATLSKYEPEG